MKGEDIGINLYERENPKTINTQHKKVLNDTSIKQLLDTIPIALMLLNNKRQIIYYNKTLGKLVFNDPDILGQRPGDVFHCINARKNPMGCGTTHLCRNCRAFNSLNQAIEGKTSTEECRIVTKQGDLNKNIDLKIHAAPYLLDRDQCIILTVEDISDVKRKEEIEKIFYQFFQNIKSGVAIYEAVDDGHDFVFTYYNKAAEKIDKTRKDDLIGKRVTDVFPGVIEFGLLDVFRSVWQTGEAEEHPITFYKDDRISGWRENYVFRLPNGEIAAVYNDITKRKQAEEKLKETKKRLDTIFNSVQTAILIINPEDHIIEDVNPMAEKLIGLPKEEITGHICHKFVCPAECGNCPVTDMNKKIDCSEKTLINSTGREIPILKTVIRETFGEKHRLIESFIDISQRKELEEKLEFERNQLFSIFDSIDEAIYIADPKTYEILSVNKKMKDLFKCRLVGQTCYRVLQGFDAPCDFCTNDIILKNKNDLYRWEYHNPKTNRDFYITDRIIKWPDGRDVRFELAVDITEEKKIERILEQRSLIDTLTEIGNRRALENEFERVLKHSHRSKEILTIILIDIDYFKRFNDSYGHVKGDECLYEVANCIKRNIMKPLDSVFRYGGEEFIIVLPNTDSIGGQIVSERVRNAVLDLKILHESSDVHEYVSISQGVYCYDGSSKLTAAQIVERADQNLYKAKESGRNCVR